EVPRHFTDALAIRIRQTSRHLAERKLPRTLELIAMPVIRPQLSQEQPQREESLVQQLAAELTAVPDTTAPMRQPLIIEEPLGQADSLHVSVIWEHWRLIDAGRRSLAILNAYELAAPDRVNQITIAMGVTTEEAVDVGLLPYGIEPISTAQNKASDAAGLMK